MNKPKIIKHTAIYQSMMDNYRKNTDKNLAKRKSEKSINSYLTKELNLLQNKEIFSDEDYFINEIKKENKIKSKIAQSKYYNEKNAKIPEDNSNTNKISKDLFFYYNYQINGRNKNKKNNKNIKPLKIDRNCKEIIKSPKSLHTINSAKRSNLSCRKSSVVNLVLPLINSKTGNYLTPYKENCQTIPNDDDLNDKIAKSENNDRIKYSSRRRKQNYLNYENKYFNQINEEHLLKNMKQYPENILLKLKLPIITNKIYNKINILKGISKNITKKINNFYNEEKIKAENEKNRIKFMDNLMS